MGVPWQGASALLEHGSTQQSQGKECEAAESPAASPSELVIHTAPLALLSTKHQPAVQQAWIVLPELLCSMLTHLPPCRSATASGAGTG